MTLTNEQEPDILKIHLHVKTEFSKSMLSKAEPEQDRHTGVNTLSAALAGGKNICLQLICKYTVH